MIRLSTLMLLTILGTCLAQPATAPATQPGENPAAAIVVYNDAMLLLDVDGMKGRMHATTPDATRYAGVAAEADRNVAILFAAAVEKFGEEARVPVGKAIEDFSSDDARAATVQLDDSGERGTLVPAGSEDGSGGIPLVRVDGKWKTDIDKLITDSGGPVQQYIDSLVRRSNLAKVMAQEVRAGRIKSLEELTATIQRERRRQTGGDVAN